MPEPRDFAASKAAAARVSPRAARRIDGARRGERFVFGFRAGSLRLRPRPSPSRRVTHGAVHRPPWHAFVARDALSENASVCDGLFVHLPRLTIKNPFKNQPKKHQKTPKKNQQETLLLGG